MREKGQAVVALTAWVGFEWVGFEYDAAVRFVCELMASFAVFQRQGSLSWGSRRLHSKPRRLVGNRYRQSEQWGAGTLTFCPLLMNPRRSNSLSFRRASEARQRSLPRAKPKGTCFLSGPATTPLVIPPIPSANEVKLRRADG
jgi:hypothetical protein